MSEKINKDLENFQKQRMTLWHNVQHMMKQKIADTLIFGYRLFQERAVERPLTDKRYIAMQRILTRLAVEFESARQQEMIQKARDTLLLFLDSDKFYGSLFLWFLTECQREGIVFVASDTNIIKRPHHWVSGECPISETGALTNSTEGLKRLLQLDQAKSEESEKKPQAKQKEQLEE